MNVRDVPVESERQSLQENHQKSKNLTSLYLISALDNSRQQRLLLEKLDSLISKGSENPLPKIHLTHSNKSFEEGCHTNSLSITSWAMSLCRSLELLSYQRTVFLPVSDQLQAIQLCIARANKKRYGEYTAVASDILDVWNYMYRRAVNLEYESGILSSEQLSHGDPVMREMIEIVQEYESFLKASGTTDHFCLYGILLEHLRSENEDLLQSIQRKIYIIEDVEQLPPIERALLLLMLKHVNVYKVSVCSPLTENCSDLDISGIGEDLLLSPCGSRILCNEPLKDISSPDVRSTFDTDKTQTVDEVPGITVTTEHIAGSLEECVLLNKADGFDGNYNCTSKKKKDVRSCYIKQLMLAYLRLLINSRDELALAQVLGMPGHDISQKGFADIKAKAQKKNMPIYQTILSLVMQLRLGGQGYQPEADCPIRKHLKPLSLFVDAMFKLQTVVEEEADFRKSATKVMSTVKSMLSRLRGRSFKQSSLDEAYGELGVELLNILNASQTCENVQRASPQQTTGKLKPSLKCLQQLCDNAGGTGWDFNITDMVSDTLLSQSTPSSQGGTTPVRIPSVFSMFRSPSSPAGGEEDSLRVKLMKKGQLPVKKTIPEKPRYTSCCAWAPDDISPIVQTEAASPITGPTLKALGTLGSHNNWREIIASLPQCQENKENFDREQSATPYSFSKQLPWKKSRRSLLTDISSLNDEVSSKKPKVDTDVAPTKGRTKSNKLKPLPSGQKQITSFFKR